MNIAQLLIAEMLAGDVEIAQAALQNQQWDMAAKHFREAADKAEQIRDDADPEPPPSKQLMIDV